MRFSNIKVVKAAVNIMVLRKRYKKTTNSYMRLNDL